MQSIAEAEQEPFIEAHAEATRALRRLGQVVEDRSAYALSGAWALGGAEEVRACGEAHAARLAEIAAAQLVVHAAGVDGLTPAHRAQLAVLLGL